MRPPDDKAALVDLLLCARHVNARMSKLTREEYENSDDIQLAIAGLVQRVGEAANKLSQGYRAKHAQTPWSQIIGMRHRLVHDYLHVNIDIVWETALVDVPALVVQLEAYVAAEAPEED